MANHVKAAVREILPGIYLSDARRYLLAADALHESETASKIGTDPLYLLYYHAAELALKAYLRYAGHTTAQLKSMKHNLLALYRDALSAGFKPSAETARSFQRVLALLYAGNKEEAFRYWNSDARTLPEMSWASETVAALVDQVSSHMAPPLSAGQVYLQVPIAIKVHVIEDRA